MWAIHNHTRIARALEALLVEGKGCLIEILVAVDLNLKAEMGCLIAHVSSLVVHDNSKLGVVLADKR